MKSILHNTPKCTRNSVNKGFTEYKNEIFLTVDDRHRSYGYLILHIKSTLYRKSYLYIKYLKRTKNRANFRLYVQSRKYSKVLILVRQLSYRCQMDKKFEIIAEEHFFERLGSIAGEEEEVKKIARLILEEANF